MTRISNSSDNPGALVIDGRGRADIGVVRSLGREGIPVYLATDCRRSRVCYSRYVTEILDLPGKKESEEKRLVALEEIGSRFAHKPVVFCTGDTSLMLVSRNRKRIEKYFLHHLGAKETIEALYDKKKFVSLSRSAKLQVPYSICPCNLQDLEKEISNLTFPVIVKPSEKALWDGDAEVFHITKGNLKGLRVDTANELLTIFTELSRFKAGIVIQDYIEGRDESIWSVYCHIGRNGKVLGAFSAQKIRTYPIHRGVGCLTLSKMHQGLIDFALHELAKLRYTGHAIVQVKYDKRTETFKIFEINCRYASSCWLQPCAGVNFPLIAYDETLGNPQRKEFRQVNDVQWIDFVHDVQAFREYRKIGEWDVAAWLKSYKGKNCYAYWWKNDPLPAFRGRS